ncbi:alpha/beta hydrolase [Solirubrobacter phytolaccae]|uniref:Alpha/beta hydrolase n=1 Tax=Solirubrobacter phytolaccae TaxID=1404360 RepID=A0A9X3N4S0_9ACTN|nr:alpha/beta hydrolase [Solirubrobacter phytolaccae]MDA0179683.1 alpha/beta hydrolase [Solirubrobacter phytolaccae]
MTLEVAEVSGARLRFRWGGAGPVVLLLHGHPRTHTTWWRVAPRLIADGFTVVCPDLPGYGESRIASYSKRAMASAVAELMERFGPYCAVGHDRGSYVAHRLAVSHGAERLVVLDGVPIAHALGTCDAKFAAAYWHWFFFLQEDKPAEEWISRDPLAWYRNADPEAMGAENYADWKAAVTNPEVVAAMVGDYRAGPQVDRADEEADFAAGRLASCPTLVGWSAHDDLEELHGDPVAVWREWLTGPVRGVKLDSGHHMAEDAPDALADAIAGFMRE